MLQATHIVYICRTMHGMSCPKSQIKSTCLAARFGNFLDDAGKGKKRQNVISVNIWFLWFSQALILASSLYQWCGFCWQSLSRNLWPKFVYIAVSKLYWKSNAEASVAARSWLHWPPVSCIQQRQLHWVLLPVCPRLLLMCLLFFISLVQHNCQIVSSVS